MGLGRVVVVLGHVEEQGPETGRRVQLGSHIGYSCFTGKWGMGSRDGDQNVTAVAGEGSRWEWL